MAPKQAEESRQVKAERKRAKAERKRRLREAAGKSPPARAQSGNGTWLERIEPRLVRIHEAMAAQSERSSKLLARLVEAREANQAPERPSVAPIIDALDEGTLEGLERALELRRENVVPVDEPLALICQAQRSGGTLLTRLFDGHPQCHAHPHELLIGGRIPHEWPQLSLKAGPETWFDTLQEEKVTNLFTKGRRMIPLKTKGEKPEGNYPCLLPPQLHRLLFLDEVQRRSPIRSERQILDAYMTSLFNAWLDNQNLHGPVKRWVTAFSPRRAWGDGLDKFFELYPDGRLISILRDPWSWYTSAQGRDPDADTDALLESWKRNATEILQASRHSSERLCVVRFDELIRDTPATMRRLADFLGIDFDPQLTTPTFNRYPVGANSSYGVQSTGVVIDPVDRYKKLLSKEQIKQIGAECGDLHEEALALVGDHASRSETAEPPLSLQTATVKQLKAIDGVRATVAREIVAFRDQRGGISSIEELEEISGVGPATIRILRERLRT